MRNPNSFVASAKAMVIGTEVTGTGFSEATTYTWKSKGVINPVFKSNKDTAWKALLSEEPNFTPLFKSSLLSLVRLFCEVWLVNLEIESFQALDASDKL